MYLICTWCILLLFCCILFNSDVSHIYIVASWTTISLSSAAFLYTLCLWSVIFIYCIFWDLPNFYLQRGILSNSIPAWVSTYTLIMDANGWKYRVVTRFVVKISVLNPKLPTYGQWPTETTVLSCLEVQPALIERIVSKQRDDPLLAKKNRWF